MNTAEPKKKSPFAVFEFVLVALMIIAIVFMLAVYFSFRETGSAPKLFGYYIYQTHAVNMAPEIPAGTAVFAKESEIDNIRPNSVVLCRIDNTLTLILVVDILEEDSGTFYIVRFKTSPPTETYKIPKESVIAKALYCDDFTGKLLDFATSKTGIILAVIVPSLIIVLMQIARLVISGRDKYEPEADDDITGALQFGNALTDGDVPAAPAAVKAAADAYMKIADETAPDKPVIPEKEDDTPASGTVMGIRAAFDEPQPFSGGSVLAVDSNGRAAYEPRGEQTPDDILLTGDKLYPGNSKKKYDKDPLPAALINEPVRIEPGMAPKNDEQSDIKDILSSAPEDFRPVVSDVLPEGITKLKGLTSPSDESETETSSKKAPKNDFTEDEPPAVFYSKETEKEEVQPIVSDDENERSIMNTDSIPENAVRPREAIAPRRKRSTRKTIEELMNMIDAEQQKINRSAVRSERRSPFADTDTEDETDIVTAAEETAEAPEEASGSVSEEPLIADTDTETDDDMKIF